MSDSNFESNNYDGASDDDFKVNHLQNNQRSLRQRDNKR